VFLVALLVALALGGPAATATQPVTFEGTDFNSVLAGTFSLDHFEVKAPVLFPGFPVPEALVAVGTVTATKSFGPPPITTLTYSDAPFDWVFVTVSATCGGATTVTFDPIGGSDYVAFIPRGEPLWDPSVPIPPWSGDVHWGVTASDSLTLDGNGGLSCAVARAVQHGQLRPLAATLNALLRQAGP
jgi:hypothetical protein